MTPNSAIEETLQRALDIVESQLVGAITLYFEDRDTIWVQSLASIARSQIEEIARKLGIRDELELYSDYMSKALPDQLINGKIYPYLNRVRSLMTHATNPNNHTEEILSENFDPANLIFCAIFDLMKIHMHQRMWLISAEELMAFLLWHLAICPDHNNQGQDLVNQYPIFSNIRLQSRAEQLRRGLKFTRWWVNKASKIKARANMKNTDTTKNGYAG